ncbi:MAG: hypothetical protein K9M03_01765 [Kiritimatiellales bacterium]|nr:hypothetical protein [Kiritimatiellales bacterium]
MPEAENLQSPEENEMPSDDEVEDVERALAELHIKVIDANGNNIIAPVALCGISRRVAVHIKRQSSTDPRANLVVMLAIHRIANKQKEAFAQREAAKEKSSIETGIIRGKLRRFLEWAGLSRGDNRQE